MTASTELRQASGWERVRCPECKSERLYFMLTPAAHPYRCRDCGAEFDAEELADGYPKLLG